jgi:molybdate transport system permease protein
MPSDLSIVLLTLKVSGAAMLVVIPAGLGLAWLLVRRRIPGKFWIEVLVSLPLALTPVVIGFALLSLLGRNSPVGRIAFDLFGRDIAFTWVAAAIASALVAFPLSVRAFIVAFATVDRRVEIAARTLGAGPWRAFFTITLPLAYPGILAGVLLGFARALSEFGATIVVAGNIPGQTQTLSLAIFTRISAGNDSAALGLIGVTVALAAASIAVHNYLLTRAAALVGDRPAGNRR